MAQIIAPPVPGRRFRARRRGDGVSRCGPLVLLLHGFPNLAYSWRKVMPAIADAGYYVVAPDRRGF